MKQLLFSILIMTVLSLLSCGPLKTFSDEECREQLGRYDTNCVIPAKWHHGTTTIVYMQDDSCVIIWGKKCEFRKNEMLYAKAEWWGAAPGSSHWKYFLINKEETIRYSIK